MVPLSDRAWGRIQELAYRVKTEGVSEPGRARLRDILNQEVSTDAVVLALTELSLLLQTQKRRGRSGKMIVDSLALYGEAIAHRYLGLPFPRSAMSHPVELGK